MAAHAVRVPVLLHKGRVGIEWLAALGAEKVPHVPVMAGGHDCLTLDGRLAATTAGAEEFVKVEMAVEAKVGTIAIFEGLIGNVDFGPPSFEALETLGVWFRVEGDAF